MYRLILPLESNFYHLTDSLEEVSFNFASLYVLTQTASLKTLDQILNFELKIGMTQDDALLYRAFLCF
jgi:hypothetical protein